jgi:iron complex outermembrane recepter protein
MEKVIGTSHRVRVRLALVAGLAGLTCTLPAQPAPDTTAAPPPSGDELIQLEAFQVTGTRIRRTDIETAAPIIRFEREAITSSGFISVGDSIRNLPFNTGGSVDSQRTATFASGARTLNLRGLGSRNTLILLNGRRTSPYGLAGGNGFDAVGDLNSIPDYAIDAIDIVKDGNSAIYGSDAVAGVVDIKTRAHFTGLTTETEIGNTTEGDAFTYSIGAGFGTTSADKKTKVVGFLDWASQNSVKLADRDFSRTSDLRSYGGRDNRSTAGFPGRVTVPASNTAGLPAGQRTFDSPTATPTAAGSVPFNSFVHNYDPNPITDLLPSNSQRGVFFQGSHEISPAFEVFAEMFYRKLISKIETAAAPVFAQNENGTAPNGQLLFPVTNPFNVFGADIIGSSLAFRLVEIGPRTTNLDIDASRVIAGARGTVLENFTWETAFLHAENQVTNTNTNQSLDRKVQAALSGVRGPVSGRTLYLNPFGPNDPELVNYLRSSFTRDSRFDLDLGDFTVSGEVFRLPAGPLGLALGGEVRKESFLSNRSEDERAGQVIGGSEGFNTDGNRKVEAFYAELSLPIFKQTRLGSLEAQLAARREDYSDFGEATKPKIGLAWKVVPSLLLRGTFSQAFKAPDLPQLYNGGTVSFTAGNNTDPRRTADPARQGRIVTIGNAALQPEETDVSFAGLVFAPKKGEFLGFLDGFEATAEYFYFETSDRITDFVGDFGYAAILNGEAAGNPLFAALVQRAEPTAADIAAGLPGALLQVNNTFRNIAKASYEGWDFSLRYDRDTPIGRFRLQTDWTYVMSNTFNSVEVVDTFTFPRYRSISWLRWRVKDWAARITVNHIAPYDDSTTAGVALGGNGRVNRIKSYTSYSPTLFYTGFKKVALELGVSNVLDEPPPRSYTESPGYDNLTGPGLGRFVYFKLTTEL